MKQKKLSELARKAGLTSLKIHIIFDDKSTPKGGLDEDDAIDWLSKECGFEKTAAGLTLYQHLGVMSGGQDDLRKGIVYLMNSISVHPNHGISLLTALTKFADKQYSKIF